MTDLDKAWREFTGNCVADDTPILLADGTTIPAADLVPGMVLRTRHDARRNFTDELAKALRIPAMLAWLSAFVDRHTWMARIPAPPKWMGLMFWIYACVAVQALALGYTSLTGHG